jgi:hypothetical protein
MFRSRRHRSQSFLQTGMRAGVAASGGRPSISRVAIATHSSQMKTRGPATSFATCDSDFLQNEHLSPNDVFMEKPP